MFFHPKNLQRENDFNYDLIFYFTHNQMYLLNWLTFLLLKLPLVAKFRFLTTMEWRFPNQWQLPDFWQTNLVWLARPILKKPEQTCNLLVTYFHEFWIYQSTKKITKKSCFLLKNSLPKKPILASILISIEKFYFAKGAFFSEKVIFIFQISQSVKKSIPKNYPEL